MFNKFRVFFQRENVTDIETDRPARAFTARLQASSTVSNNENVRAELAKDLVVAALKSFSHCGKNHDRNHTPGNAEHR
jgi:hypothetical protein